jgi:hypothetical protein
MSLKLNRAGVLSFVSVLVLVLLAAAPAIAAPAATAPPAAQAAPPAAGAPPAPAGPVDLNKATQTQLETLPGVGMATAKKIVAARPYHSVEELSRAGLSAKGIQKLKPLVTVSWNSADLEPLKPGAVRTPPAAGMVWVNPDTKIFHKPGDPWYGKTKHGEWMNPAAALKAGYQEAKKGLKGKTPP